MRLPVLAIVCTAVAGPATHGSAQAPPHLRLGELPRYFGASVSGGRQWYVCDHCGTAGNDAVTLTGRGGLQVADGRLLLGAEGSWYINGNERVLFLLLSGSGLVINRRVVLGGGFGLAGTRVPTTSNSWFDPTFQPTGWHTIWGLGADLHLEMLFPVSTRVSIAPRVAYNWTIDHPLQFMTTGGVSGTADVTLLQVGMSVLWRGRPAR